MQPQTVISRDQKTYALTGEFRVPHQNEFYIDGACAPENFLTQRVSVHHADNHVPCGFVPRIIVKPANKLNKHDMELLRDACANLNDTINVLTDYGSVNGKLTYQQAAAIVYGRLGTAFVDAFKTITPENYQELKPKV